MIEKNLKKLIIRTSTIGIIKITENKTILISVSRLRYKLHHEITGIHLRVGQ